VVDVVSELKISSVRLYAGQYRAREAGINKQLMRVRTSTVHNSYLRSW